MTRNEYLTKIEQLSDVRDFNLACLAVHIYKLFDQHHLESEKLITDVETFMHNFQRVQDEYQTKLDKLKLKYKDGNND